jgi:hypothetical protein
LLECLSKTWNLISQLKISDLPANLLLEQFNQTEGEPELGNGTQNNQIKIKAFLLQ